MMTDQEFIARLKDAAAHKTLYVLGCFGAPMMAKNKTRYKKNNSYNAGRAKMIDAATPDTFGFDCVCLIKGILWGWKGDCSRVYGGADYRCNGVPDVGADSMMNKYCVNVSKHFDDIVPGEAVWLEGHIGVYIGDGQVIECTPKWKNCVQYTWLGNLSQYRKGNYRCWTKHGKLPWIQYTVKAPEPVNCSVGPDDSELIQYVVKCGDTLSKIATAYNVSGGYQTLAAINNIKNPSVITIGQVIKIPKAGVNFTQPVQTPQPVAKKETVYTVVKGDTLSKIAKKFNVAGGYKAIAKLNNIPFPYIIRVGKEIKIPN